MGENFNGILTKKILSNIPKNKQPVQYLMDILDIGRESTYRRMRGSIPYTFEEIAKLSKNLNFSIDEIVGRNLIDLDPSSDSSPKKLSASIEHYCASHLNYCHLLELVRNASKIDIALSLNRLNSFLSANFDSLFKFYYYKWMHQFGGISSNHPLAAIELPAQVVDIQQKIKSKAASVKNITFIFDQQILLRLIQELQCYHSRKLITDTELLEIKKDIVRFIDGIEKYIQSGANGSVPTYHFYLSLVDIEVNSVYGTLDGNVISQYWLNTFSSVNIRNNGTIAMHKNWIHSLKRSSILISHSNEIVQGLFLNQQRENIDKITNDLFFYYV